jgi:3-methyladenine DNA glycosylase AlkC
MKEFSKLTNKSGKHKDWYSLDFIKVFCKVINPDELYFKNKAFVNSYKDSYLKLELKDRLKCIAGLIDQYVEKNHKTKIKILKALLNEELEEEEGMFSHGYHLYPVSQWIEKNFESDVTENLNFIEDLTKRFTGEWAIRPIANAFEARVLKQAKLWAKSKNVHVRRLSSEGLRPKLPWGTGIAWVTKDPKKIIPIYNSLRNDKSLYVRRSVANALGDIIKIDEDLAYKTLSSWLLKTRTKENLWVIRHAIRHPLKHKVPKYLKMQEQLVKYKSQLK